MATEKTDGKLNMERVSAPVLPVAVMDSLEDIESRAAEWAAEAGHIVSSLFGKAIEVDYKDDKRMDPVTAADKQSQEFLAEAISRTFPDHGILGEEGGEEETESPCPDILWVLDPLDGTTNFLNGFPLYAVSIGVLHRGTPIAGSVYVPWPEGDGGQVLHARLGGGAFANGERLLLGDTEGPVPNRLTGIPGSLGGQYRIGKPLRGKVGEPRVTGSITYELAMVARGVLQYCIIGGPRMWDMAAGALIVVEAGGSVVMRRKKGWEPMGALVETWEERAPTMKELRRWSGPLVAGNAQAAPFVAANLRRRRPWPTRRITSWLRRRRRARGVKEGKKAN